VTSLELNAVPAISDIRLAAGLFLLEKEKLKTEKKTDHPEM